MNYRFHNLLGAPYRGGDAVFAGDSSVLLSAVGNRVASTDLSASSSLTLPFESSSNVTRLAVSPSGDFLLSVDDAGRALYANLGRRAVLHRIAFKSAPSAVRFSPDGNLIAVAVGKLVQIWRSPAFRKEFFPFHLLRTFPGFAAGVTAFDWSPDSSFLLASCKDLTARLLPVKKGLGGKPFLFVGHRAAVVGAFFATDKKTGRVTGAYTISKDGAIFTWNLVEGSDDSPPPSPGTPEQEAVQDGEAELDGDEPELDGGSRKRKSFGESEEPDTTPLHFARWELQKKDFFMQSPAKLTACDYHRELDMVVVGFSNGVFGLYQMPDFVCLHLLSISREKITTAIFNSLGNWLVFGCAKLGQLLVWEWRSESYILKQQGHYFDVNCIAYSPDSQLLATGADDNKVKIFVWSMKTGRLLDILSGHQGPVHGLMFSPINAILASSSWDKTVRLWDVFESKGAVETFQHSHDVLTLAYRPDGRQIACSTLDGLIHFWDPFDGLLMYTIEGRRDIAGGRLMTDRRSAANTSIGKYFTTLCYSADGTYILAGGNSKYICMYDVGEQVLLRRFQITRNLSLDGVLDFLNSKKMTDAGALDLIDDEDSDVEEGIDQQTRGNLGLGLPGSMANRGRPIARTKCVKFAPTGRSFAAATTDGVLLYSVDDSFIFDPTDLDIDVTPEKVEEALEENQQQRALLLSLRLNEDSLIKKCIFSVDPSNVRAICSSTPLKYLQRLIEAFSDLLESCPHLEFILLWSQELCKIHGNYIQQNSRALLPALKSLQKSITRIHQDLADTCSSNEYMLKYLCSSGTRN
uniref:Small-subunit processome Utp12 domain-containing protein n=1 Tax=Oryza glumipatula TaxID=40148 RepID=A0A0E0A1P8_9ORYZ